MSRAVKYDNEVLFLPTEAVLLEISNGHSYRHINYTRSIIITVNVCRLLKENPSPPSISARNFNTFTNLKHRIFILS